MSSINFIQPLHADTAKRYTYSDIYLDLKQDEIYAKPMGYLKNKSDIAASYDIDAIKNSVYSLFNTKKGQRVLTPEYGMSLEKYIFEPVSQAAAYSIGKDIQSGLEKYEPRVTPLKINVSILPTNDGYDVQLVLYIPHLSINTTIDAGLESSGFFVR